MKKITSLLIVFILVLSIPMTALATDPSSVDNNEIQQELNKIKDNDKREKIEQILFTPFYSEVFEGDQVPTSNENSIIETIQYLNEYSGEDLDNQIANQLKDTINKIIQSPNASFNNEAVSLVQQYCPEELNKVKSKTAPVKMLLESETTSQVLAASSDYNRTVTYGDYSGYYGLLWELTITVSWGTNSNSKISYCREDSRSCRLAVGYIFRIWFDEKINIGDYVATVRQECSVLSGTGSSFIPWIQASVEYDGRVYVTGGRIL